MDTERKGAPMKDKPISPEVDEIELHPDAMERLERAVKTIAQHPPVHRPKASATKPKRSVVKGKH